MLFLMGCHLNIAVLACRQVAQGVAAVVGQVGSALQSLLQAQQQGALQGAQLDDAIQRAREMVGLLGVDAPAGSSGWEVVLRAVQREREIVVAASAAVVAECDRWKRRQTSNCWCQIYWTLVNVQALGILDVPVQSFKVAVEALQLAISM